MAAEQRKLSYETNVGKEKIDEHEKTKIEDIVNEIEGHCIECMENQYPQSICLLVCCNFQNFYYV